VFGSTPDFIGSGSRACVFSGLLDKVNKRYPMLQTKRCEDWTEISQAYDTGQCHGIVAGEADILTMGEEAGKHYACTLARIEPAFLSVHSTFPVNYE
jgi:hypothetical protein